MNLNSLTYNQKIKLLIATGAIFLLICYQYAFKKTWTAYNEYTENKMKAEQSADFINLLPNLQTEEKKISNLIKRHTADTLHTPKATLAFITSFCKESSLKLTEYLPMQVVESSGFNIATSQVSIEGNYTGILRLLYELENNQFYGRLCSANFKSVEDVYKDKITLTCTFYLQNLISKDDSK